MMSDSCCPVNCLTLLSVVQQLKKHITIPNGKLKGGRPGNGSVAGQEVNWTAFVSLGWPLYPTVNLVSEKACKSVYEKKKWAEKVLSICTWRMYLYIDIMESLPMQIDGAVLGKLSNTALSITPPHFSITNGWRDGVEVSYNFPLSVSTEC